MSDKTALSLTLHATHADDREAISAALAAQGLETMAGEFLDDPTPGVRYTDPEVDISNGVEHRTLAEALATHTRHTAFELVHHPDLANVGCYAAYAPGHELYFTFADADGDPYVVTEHVTRDISEAPRRHDRPCMAGRSWPSPAGYRSPKPLSTSCAPPASPRRPPDPIAGARAARSPAPVCAWLWPREIRWRTRPTEDSWQEEGLSPALRCSATATPRWAAAWEARGAPISLNVRHVKKCGVTGRVADPD